MLRIWIWRGQRPNKLHSQVWSSEWAKKVQKMIRRYSGWLHHIWWLVTTSPMVRLVIFNTPQRQKQKQTKNISQGEQSDEGEVRWFSNSVCCCIFVYLFIIYLILLLYYAVLWFDNKFIVLFLLHFVTIIIEVSAIAIRLLRWNSISLNGCPNIFPISDFYLKLYCQGFGLFNIIGHYNRSDRITT